MLKLIVSDLDGTLLPYGQECVPNTVKKLIRELLDCGVHFAVSSGRTYSELLKFLPEFENDIYFICCDGAYYLKGGKILYSKHIMHEQLLYVSMAAAKTPCIYHSAAESYATAGIPEGYHELFSPKEISSAEKIPVNEKIYKITLFSSPIRLPAHASLRVHWNEGETADITEYVNRFSNKGAALSDLKSRLFLSGLDVAVIGDADNDLSMMRGVKYSFAVGDRSKLVGAVADYKVDSAQTALYRLLSLK